MAFSDARGVSGAADGAGGAGYRGHRDVSHGYWSSVRGALMTISSGSPRSAAPLSRLVPTRVAGAAFVEIALGPELLVNGGFETLGLGDPDFFGTWAEAKTDGAIAV